MSDAPYLSSMEKIRAELAWVKETPDPNKCGCRIFVAVRKVDTGQGLAPVLSRRSSGRFDGSTTVPLAMNMDGVEASLADT
jgi:hypothetical protein